VLDPYSELKSYNQLDKKLTQYDHEVSGSRFAPKRRRQSTEVQGNHIQEFHSLQICYEMQAQFNTVPCFYLITSKKT
jgi:hypothetical protein